MTPPSDSIASQTSAASPRGGRRRSGVPFTVVVSALAVNLLLAAAMVAAITSRADGSGGDGGAAVYVLPPADAQEVFLAGDVTPYGIRAYRFVYQDSQGVPLELEVRPYQFTGTPDPQRTASRPGSVDALGLPPGAPFEPIVVDGLDDPVAVCTRIGSLATNPPTALPADVMLVGDGPMFVGPPMGGAGTHSDSFVEVTVMTNSCSFDPVHTAAIERQLRSLRFVTYPEWYAYAATKSRLASVPSEARPTIEQVHFEDEDRALTQVADAIAGLDLRLPDGAYPNLEGGLVSNDYEAMFDAAQRASGASPGATFVPTEIWFRSESEAIVTFSITAGLPSGSQTFSQTGSVVRWGDRWLVTRSTVLSMLGRSGAKTP